MSESQSDSAGIPLTPVVIFLVVQACVLLAWAPLGRGELNSYLSAVGVVPLHVPFGDFRTISEGVKFAEAGGDPYVDGRYEFMGRKFNYPPIWLKMSFLGLSPEAVSYVFFAFASLFAISLLLLFWEDKSRAWPLYFPFLFSPPVVLAMERCNNDLLMFFLVVLGVFVGRGWESCFKRWFGGCLFLGATLLKLFPVFSFYFFLRDNWKTSLLYLGPFAFLSGSYFVSIKPILDLIGENTPRGAYLSFGVQVIPTFLSKTYPDAGFSQGVIPWILVAMIASACLILALRLGRQSLEAEGLHNYDADLFRVGGAIYIAVFLTGNSYDYRMMFLLLTLPFSFRVAFGSERSMRWFQFYLGVLLIGLWINEAAAHYWSNGTLMEAGFFLNEIASWVLFFILCVSQFKMLPGFVRQLIYRRPVAD